MADRSGVGKWSQRTVARLIEDADIVGLAEYGVLSAGRYWRFDPEAPKEPRVLADQDRAGGRARRVRNPSEGVIRVPAKHQGEADPDLFRACQELRAERAQNRTGVTRQPDPGKYPLALRVFDLSAGCGKVMYGRTQKDRPIYLCSGYMRSAGLTARTTRWTPRPPSGSSWPPSGPLQWTGGRATLRERLEEIAEADADTGPAEDAELVLVTGQLTAARAELQAIQRNLTRSTADDEVYAVVMPPTSR